MSAEEEKISKSLCSFKTEFSHWDSCFLSVKFKYIYVFQSLKYNFKKIKDIFRKWFEKMAPQE